MHDFQKLNAIENRYIIEIYTMKYSSLLFGIVLLLSTLPSFLVNDWNYISTKDGIDIYSKHDIEDRNWTKLVATINGKPTEVMEYASDVTRFNEWIYACSEAKILEKGDNTSVYYYVTDLPFPLTDRDAVIKREVFQSGTNSYSSRSILTTSHSVTSKLVRLEGFEAIWFFDALPNGKTKLTYELFANPGGNIPTWVAEKFSSNGPFRSIQNLKAHFE